MSPITSGAPGPDGKSFYDLLGIDRAATLDEIKKAFRQEIARYHPDKVQHLGAEFQEMAARRAARLTEAYRVLTSAGPRAEYDAQLAAAAVPTDPPPVAPAPDAPRVDSPAGDEPHDPPPAAGGGQFVQDRERRDVVIRRAAMERFERGLAIELGTYERPAVHGFDLACLSKPRFFPRRAAPRVLGRFVTRLDARAVAETLALVVRAGPAWTSEELIVFLMATDLAPARELADAIAVHRRRPRGIAGRITVVPLDVRDWTALMPQDAPEVARSLVARLKTL